MTYMAQVRAHLAGSREERLPFEQAWRLATEAHPWPDADYYGGGVRKQAERWFREGYYGRPLPGPDMRAVCGMFEEGADAEPAWREPALPHSTHGVGYAA